MVMSAVPSLGQQRNTFQQYPWQRRSTSRSYQQQRRPLAFSRQHREDYLSHFLDDEEWMTNKKVRYWDGQLATRKPNQYSWTSRIILANIFAYGIQMVYPSFTNWGIKISDKILRGEQLYRLVSSTFLHGNIFHLFTNMYSLQNVGPPVERLFGSGRFLAGYFAAGVAGTFLSAVQSPNPSLGASGAVFGVLGAFFVFLSRHEWLLGARGQAYSDAITQTVLLNLIVGAFNPVIDNWGHLGGAVGGAAMAYYFGPRLFLVELPDGGRIVVDKPVLRLPPSIESIPEKVVRRTTRIIRRMQVWRFRADLPEKPWRPKPSGVPSDFSKKMYTPTKSIKPKFD